MTPEEIRKYDQSILNRDWSDSFITKMLQVAYGIDPTSNKIPMSTTYGGHTDGGDTKFSDEFVEKMKKAILLSHEKYGWMSQTYPELAQAANCAAERLVAYQKSHNKDYLIDIANFAMIEYMYPSCRKAHVFKTTFVACDPSDSLTCMADRLQSYFDTANKIYLAELAFYAMREYINPSYDDAHYTPGDSDKSIGLAGGTSYKQMMEELQ